MTATTLIIVIKHSLPLTALHSFTLSVCRALKEEGWVCQPPARAPSCPAPWPEEALQGKVTGIWGLDAAQKARGGPAVVIEMGEQHMG